MDAGKLRHRVAVERATVTDSANGGRNETWTPITAYNRLPVCIEDLGGGEYEQADRTQARVQFRVTCRYLKSITPNAGLRLKWGDRVLNVTSIANKDGRHQWHELMCTEADYG